VKGFLLLVLGLVVASDGYAAKRDFKGLFGSYRRERFTENEGHSSDLGIDLMLSTLLPATPIVKTSETRGADGVAMNYSTFFNVETTIFLTLSYHFEAFANIGYYSYDTRKQNSSFGTANLPLFQQFEMHVIPLLAGIKYRLSTEDIVPYIGAGAGVSYVQRKASYDYNPQYNEQFATVLTAEVLGGLEFFFSSKAGIRMELAAYYMQLSAFTFDTGGTAATFPIFNYQANPWTVKYSSGIFFLF